MERKSSVVKARPSILAGTWYPEDKGTLSQLIDRYLSQAPKTDLRGQLIGLLAPHAGYVYSGLMAAYAYKQLQGLHFDTAIILGPNHHSIFRDIVVTDKDYYETPLGLVPVNRDLLARLSKKI